MKILHVVSTINPKAGGVSQALVTMISQLREHGIDNVVVTVDRGEETFLLNLGFEVHTEGPGKTGWGYSRLLKKWLSANLYQYDSVVVHGLWQYQSMAVYQAYRQIVGHKPRLFVMPHGMLDPYFQKAKERRIKAVRNYIIWHAIEHRLINIADALLFTCEEEKLLAKQTFKRYRPKQAIVVGLGVDKPPTFNVEMTRAFEAKVGAKISNYWLFISRIHEKKGVDLLIKAYLLLKNQGLKLPKLVIAGPGLETNYGKTMLALAGNDVDIYFPGMLTGHAKWGAFYGADFFILPSHQENFGIAVVEALACSTPVLISNKVNIWREVLTGKGGLIGEDDLGGIEVNLKKWLYMTSEESKQVRVNAYNTYSSSFTKETIITKLIETLSS